MFLPVANGYRRVPGPMRAGVHNFFRNLSEVASTANYILQWRLSGGARSLGRFVINSTIGIGGLFDVATKFKLSNEQTRVRRHHVHLGPASRPVPGHTAARPIHLARRLRVARGLRYRVRSQRGEFIPRQQDLPARVVNAIDQRAAIDFRYYGSGSPFEYETIRFLYVHRDLIQDEALRARGRHRPQDPAAPAGK